MCPMVGNPSLRRSRVRRLTIRLLLTGALVLPLAAAGQGNNHPAVALPLIVGDTDRFFYFDLGNGSGYLADRLRDPLQIRVRLSTQNLFGAIGRPTEESAVAGEILLGPIFVSSTRVGASLFVEASTGYVAFFDEAGRNNQLGKVSVALGRPFAPLRSTDGNYALLMRRDGSGRTEGAYLYHATTGRGLYYGGLRGLETDSRVATITNLPALTGRVAAAAIQSGREETWTYFVADGGNGEIYYFDLDDRQPARVAVRKSSSVLTEVFPEPGTQPAPVRFLAVPILAVDDRTQHIFVLDASSGDMALVEDVDSQQPALRKAALNLHTATGLTTSTEPRHWTSVPNLSTSGQTIGIWLRDSVTRNWVYLDNPDSPAEMTVRTVAAGG